MSAKHTPGPWEFAEWNAGVNSSPGFGILAENGSLNVTVHTRKPKGDGYADVDCTEQARADAQLIAAAPDLLSLVTRAMSDRIDNEWIDDARAAIAKAKGAQP